MARLLRLSSFWRLFPQQPVEETKETKAKRARSIVRSLANGNVSIRAGHYVTEDQLAERRKEILRHKFI